MSDANETQRPAARGFQRGADPVHRVLRFPEGSASSPDSQVAEGFRLTPKPGIYERRCDMTKKKYTRMRTHQTACVQFTVNKNTVASIAVGRATLQRPAAAVGTGPASISRNAGAGERLKLQDDR